MPSETGGATDSDGAGGPGARPCGDLELGAIVAAWPKLAPLTRAAVKAIVAAALAP
jgi:hypothetical protein